MPFKKWGFGAWDGSVGKVPAAQVWRKNSDSEHTCRDQVRWQDTCTDRTWRRKEKYLWALLASQLSQMASSWLNEKLPWNTRWRVIKEDTRNQLLTSADACICTADHIGIGKHTHIYYNKYKHNATGSANKSLPPTQGSGFKSPASM